MKRMFRKGVVVGGAVGYVLGTKAGRERYEQMRKLWNDALDRFGGSGGSVARRAPAPDGFGSALPTPVPPATTSGR